MNLNPLPIAAKNFAHLISGRGTSSAKKAESEEEEDKDEEKEKPQGEDKKPPADDKEDGKKSKGKKCEDEEDEKENDTEGKKAEKDDSDEDNDGNKTDKKGKKASADAEGFDTATLARCETIFASEHAAGRPDMAAELAFNSKLSAEQAIAVMKMAGPISKGSRLSDKMASVKNPDVGASAPAGEAPSAASKTASLILSAYSKANGEAK